MEPWCTLAGPCRNLGKNLPRNFLAAQGGSAPENQPVANLPFMSFFWVPPQLRRTPLKFQSSSPAQRWRRRSYRQGAAVAARASEELPTSPRPHAWQPSKFQRLESAASMSQSNKISACSPPMPCNEKCGSNRLANNSAATKPFTLAAIEPQLLAAGLAPQLAVLVAKYINIQRLHWAPQTLREMSGAWFAAE